MRKKIYGFVRRLIAAIVCLNLSLSVVSGMGFPAFAASSGRSSAAVNHAQPTEHILEFSRVADPDTMDSYINILLNESTGSRYAGRVWTDKSVFAYHDGNADENNTSKTSPYINNHFDGNNTLTLDMTTDGYNGDVSFNADFLHVFSALASSQVVNEYPPSPIDLVIVFDMSGSMGQDTRFGIDTGGNYYVAHNKVNDVDSNGKELTGDKAWPEAGVPMAERIKNSRIQKTLDAINETIDALMAQNPQNRVAVCGYGANAVVLMPLGHYKRNGEADYLSVGGMETLYHPSDLVYKTTDDDDVSEDGWYWQNNRDTCYTVVVNAEYNTYTGILNENGDGEKQEGENGGTDKWTKISKTVSNNVLDSDGNPVKAFPGVADQSNEAGNEANRNASHEIYEAYKANEKAAGEKYGAGKDDLKTAMANTQGLKADDYVGYFTNTQGGIYLAYKQLADSTSTTYTEPLSNGVISTVARIPAAIIMSDGGANFAFNEMGQEDGYIYTVDDWNSRYGQKAKAGTTGPDVTGESNKWYMQDDSWDSAASPDEKDSGTPGEGHDKDYSHRLETHSIDGNAERNVGDEWYNVYLPGDDTLAPGTPGGKYTSDEEGKWDGLHGIYNTGADYYKDGTLTSPPAWNNAGVLYSSDNNPLASAGTILEVLLTASYMSDVVKEHYNNGWAENNATQDSRIELSTYTMNVDTAHVPQWGRLRLYPTLDPKEYSLDDIATKKWYTQDSKFGTNEDLWTAMGIGEEMQAYVTMKGIFEQGISGISRALYEGWQQWKAGNNTALAIGNDSGKPYININSISDGQHITYTNKNGEEIEVTRDEILDNIAYNDMFYDVGSENLSDIFGEILALILGKVFVPVSGDNDAGVGDSITYQDPIGDYMEIKNGAVTYRKESEGAATTDYDMSMLLFGEMYGLVRTGVYDYKWNDEYMAKKHSEGQGTDPFAEGWYKGEAASAQSGGSGELPTDNNGLELYKTAAQAWADGWVYRINYKTLIKNVPIVNAKEDDTPEKMPPQVKNTVYTIYRFSCTNEKYNELRRNPVYGEVPDDLENTWNSETAGGQYPNDDSLYKDYPGVYRLSDIRVWVEYYGDFVDHDGAITTDRGYDSSLYLNVPAAAIPTELATITLGRNGVLSYKTNLGSDHLVGSYDTVVTKDESGKEAEQKIPVDEKRYNSYCYQSTPLRLFYTVGLEEDLIIRDEGGNQIGVNVAALPEEYVSTHTIAERSTIYFVSNYFSATKYDDYVTGESTRGDPAVTFSPSSDNRYYVFQKPLPLYAHAYRVQADGSLLPVDRKDGQTWGGNLGGNGKTVWADTEDGKTGGSSWPGGVYMGVYESEEAFKNAATETSASISSSGAGMPKTDKLIKDSQGIWYPYVENGIVFLTSDLLDNVDENSGKSFASDDYFFLLLEYYTPGDEVGVNNSGETLPGTHSGSAIQYAVARKGSDFGSGFASTEINNGDMLCWAETQGRLNLNNNIGFKYLSFTDTGDKTRGRPTFEKLTENDADELKKVLKKCGIKEEQLDDWVTYWQNIQKDPQVQAALEAAKAAQTGNKDTLTEDGFNAYFKFAVSARPGGIRTGNMANERQRKTLNPTETSETYYVPTISNSSSIQNIVLNSYLGNNGRLEVGNSQLLVTKTLHIPEDYTYGSKLNKGETFNYQIYIAGAGGSMDATMVNYNPISKLWQCRIGYIDVLVDTKGMLLTSDSEPALFVYEGGTAKQVTAVTDDNDNTTRYYYVNDDDERTYVDASALYYLYLSKDPGSSDDSDKLTRRIYQDIDYNDESDKIAGFENSAVMYYGTDQTKPADSTGGDIRYEPLPSSEITAGTVVYEVKEAELVPKSEVDGDESWSHAGGYQEIKKYPIATVKPGAYDSTQEIISPFGTKTIYMKKTLEFGKNANSDGSSGEALTESDLYDQFNPSYDRSDLFGTLDNATIARSTAEFTLKQGEGLLLTGLGNRVAYRFTEKLTDEQIAKGYVLEQINHIQQSGSESIYKLGLQEIPTYEDTEGAPTTEPFHHTNATMWEYYATFGPNEYSSHHYPEQSGEVKKNPACKQYDETTKTGCDVSVDGKIRHYMYREGELIDSHYEGEPSSFSNRISRYLVSPTVHFGIDGDSEYSQYSAANIEKYVCSEEYNGVYSVFGNTGYFEEQANFTNTVKTGEFKLTKKLVDGVGVTEEQLVDDAQDFTFEISFKKNDNSNEDIDGNLKYEIYDSDDKLIKSGILKKYVEASALNAVSVPSAAFPMATSPSAPTLMNRFDGETIGNTAELLLSKNGEGVSEDISAQKESAEGSSRIYWTVTLKKDQYIKVSNLPYEGYNYSVKEIGLDGTLYAVADGVTNPLSGTANPGLTEVEFTNKKQAGSLTVEKKISLEEKDSSKVKTEITDDEKELEFKFEVELSGKNIDREYKAMKMTRKVQETGGVDGHTFESVSPEYITIKFDESGKSEEFKLKSGESLTIYGIPLGTTYTVTEKAEGHGYWSPTVSVDGSGNSDGAVATGTITEKGGKAECTVTFDNKKPNPKPVSVSIGLTKEVTIIGEDSDFEEYPKISAEDFTFEVTPDSDNGEDDPFKAELKDGKKIVNIGSVSGYTATANIFKNLKYEKKGTYKYYVREIVPELEKRIDGMTYSDVRYTIEVVITEDTVTVTEGGSDETRLALKADVYVYTDGSDTRKLVASSKGKEYDVDACNNDVRFENIIGTGELIITKEVVNAPEDDNTEFRFTLELTQNNDPVDGPFPYVITNADKEEIKHGNLISSGSGEGDDIVADGNRWTLTLKNGEIITIKELPAGAAYKITEADSENSRYFFKSVSVGGTPSNEKTVSGVIGADKVTVSYKNEYIVGSMTISKALVIGSNPDPDTEFEFKLTLNPPDGKGIKDLEDVKITPSAARKDNDDGTVTYTFNLTADGNRVTLTDIPLGTSYTLTETQNAKDNYVFESAKVTVGGNAEEKNADDIKGTISAESSNIAIVVTNKPCTPTKVSLAGTKKVIGADFELGGKFKFQITRTSASGPNPKPDVVSESSDGTIRFFDNLEFTKSGTYTYTIEEVTPPYIEGIEYDDTVYTVTVKVSETDNGELKVTVSYLKDGEAADSIIFENSHKLGSLKVQKIIDDSFNPLSEDYKKNLKFNFKLTLKNDSVKSFKPLSKNASLKKAEDGDYWTFTLNGNETIEITNLPVGTECSVEETNPLGFTPKYDPESRKAVISEDSEAVTITVTNKNPASNELTLTGKKTFKYDDGARIDLEGGEFEFILSAKDDKAPMPNGQLGGSVTISNNSDGSFSFEKITYKEVGTYVYEIREKIPVPDDGEYEYDGSVYTVNVTVSKDGDALKADVEVTKKDKTGNTVEWDSENTIFEFTNTKKRTPAELTIEGLKNLDGEPSGVEFSFGIKPAPESPENIPMPEKKTVTNNGEGKFFFGPIKYTAAGEYVYEIYEIPNPDEDKYVYDTTVYRITVRVTEEGDGLTAEYGASEEVTITARIVYYATVINGMTVPAATPNMGGGIIFNNTTVTPIGNLTISKTVKNEDGSIVDDGSDTTLFDFTVKLAAPEGTSLPSTYVPDEGKDYMSFRLAAGQPMSFSNLPVGTEYYISEVNQQGYTCENPEANGVITENGETVTVEIVNIKPAPKQKTGNLEVVKHVTGDGDKLKEWHITVTLGEALTGQYGDMYFENGVASFTVTDGVTVTAVGLPAGITYTVAELEENTGGYVTEYVGKTGEIPADGTAHAEVVNDLPVTPPPPEKETGALEVVKHVTGDGDKLKEWHITVTLGEALTGQYGEMYFENGVASFTVTDGVTVTAVGLPAGIAYTVAELEENTGGYVTTYVGKTGEIPADGTAHAEVVNDLPVTPPPSESETGSLTVAKTVQSPDSNDYMRPFGFVVQLSDPTINGRYGDMVFSDGVAYITLTSGQSLTAVGLPVGISYSIYETDAYGFTVLVNGMPSSGVASGTILSDSVRFEAFTNISNIPEPEYGGLTVTKTVEGSGADYEKYFTFTVTLSEPLTGQYGQMFFNNGVAVFTLKHGESCTAFGISAGTYYTVTEYDNEGYEVTSDGEVGTVIANTIVSADFVNTREEPEEDQGGLTVKKTVTGSDGDRFKEFMFTVTLSAPSINGVYGDMMFVDGVAAFTLRHNESITALGLPAGISYTVTETDNEGYTVVSFGETGTIPANGEAAAEFVNSRGESDEFGNLTVEKFVTGFGIDSQDFTFTVTLSAPITGQYGQMFFDDGVAVFTLKHGETATAVGLPAGVSYTVVESNNDYYIVSSSGDAGIIVNNGSAYCEYINYLTEEDYPKVVELLEQPAATVDTNPPTGIDYIDYMGTVKILLVIVALGVVVKRIKER